MKQFPQMACCTLEANKITTHWRRKSKQDAKTKVYMSGPWIVQFRALKGEWNWDISGSNVPENTAMGVIDQWIDQSMDSIVMGQDPDEGCKVLKVEHN